MVDGDEILAILVHALLWSHNLVGIGQLLNNPVTTGSMKGQRVVRGRRLTRTLAALQPC
jgi:hypothetical protein